LTRVTQTEGWVMLVYAKGRAQLVQVKGAIRANMGRRSTWVGHTQISRRGNHDQRSRQVEPGWSLTQVNLGWGSRWVNTGRRSSRIGPRWRSCCIGPNRRLRQVGLGQRFSQVSLGRKSSEFETINRGWSLRQFCISWMSSWVYPSQRSWVGLGWK